MRRLTYILKACLAIVLCLAILTACGTRQTATVAAPETTDAATDPDDVLTDDDWDNVVTHEAYTIHDGVATWGANATYFTKANYTFFGTTADGVLWACAVDGRREGVAEGLAYQEVAALQLELGCTGGVCCDGGGSTTMAIRKDLMTASDICDTQRTSSSSQNYYTMCYLDDGSERAVINQLLFVEAPLEAAPAKRSLAFYVD